jgi:DNA-binding MarR family transcriptional regulator
LDDYKELNEILVRLFRSIMDVEEKAIITREFQDITNNDMHVIEAIGIGTPKNMSSIAKKLSVTVGTLTIAMNSLVKKGYVKRERGEEDRRVVYISLSDMMKSVPDVSAEVQKLEDEFDDDEKKILIRGLTKLDNWFKNKEEENKKNRE